MEVTLDSALSWILTICVLVTTASIIILGTWIILNYFVWEVLARRSLRFLKLEKPFIQFIFYRKQFMEWVKEHEGETDSKQSRCCGRCDGINDICVADMVCEQHEIEGCEDCFGKRM